MKPVIKVDRRGILAMAREIARYSPRSVEFIFRSEVGSIVKICALQAKIASKAAIRREVIARSEAEYRAENDGRVYKNLQRNAGRTWFVPPDQAPTRGPRGNFYLILEASAKRGHRVPDEVYAAFAAAVGDREGYIKAMVAIRFSRRGLMRFSWIQIADALRVSLSTIAPAGNLQEAVARAARGPRGRLFMNGRATVEGTGTKLRIIITNESPLAVKNDGQARLDAATARRLKGFAIALKVGLLTDLQRRAARWPGIFVRPA